MTDTSVAEIVGFDLGHGETAVAKVPIHSDSDPEMLELFGRKNQITAIGHHPERGVLIGTRALVAPSMTRFEICFKQRPTGDPLYRENMRQFLAACYQHLVEAGQVQDGEATRLIVGCPSGWPDDVIADYQELLRTSGVSGLDVVRESRAALLHAKEGGKLTLGELRQSVLIIDLGSSTTDFTLIRGATEEPLDFGDDLGASLIDRALFDRTLERHEQATALAQAFADHPLHRARCEVQCRKAKEVYFADEETYEDPGSQAQAGFERIQDVCIFEPIVNGPIMTEILNRPLAELGQRSWIQRFADLVAEAKQHLDRHGASPAVILLTGGASRMCFVRDTCEATFRNASVRRDSEPEFCIARGLARWGRVDHRTTGFMNEVQDLVDTGVPDLLKQHIPALRGGLGAPLAEGLVRDVVRVGLLSWRSGQVPTLQELEPHLRMLAEQWVESPDATAAVADCCASWFDPIRRELNHRTNEICQRYRIPAGALSIQVDFDAARKIDPATVSLNGSTSLADVTNLAAVITALVIASLLGGGGMALLMSGPVGWIIGLLIGLVAAHYGKAEADKRLREMDIPTVIRALVLRDSSIEKQCAKLTPELCSQINGQLGRLEEPFEELTIRLQTQLQRVLQEKADESRLLIK